jgi:hypothetical protein
MSLNDLKSEYSYAYVRAVAATAGYFTEERYRGKDADGVDLTILSRTPAGTSIGSTSLDLQVKATAEWQGKADYVFDLEMKNYRELRSDIFQVPRILVVVNLPKLRTDWVEHSHEQLALRRCAYWKSLRGWPESQNTTSSRITMNAEQVLDVHQLQMLMKQIENGELP